MEISDRRNICQLVAGILVSDDLVTEDEVAFLQRIYRRFGLPVEEAETVQPIEAGAASATLRQLPEQVQAKVVALLVEAAIADGVVDGRERAYLLVAVAALGIEADVMEQRIATRLERLDEHGPMSNPR